MKDHIKSTDPEVELRERLRQAGRVEKRKEGGRLRVPYKSEGRALLAPGVLLLRLLRKAIRKGSPGVIEAGTGQGGGNALSTLTPPSTPPLTSPRPKKERVPPFAREQGPVLWGWGTALVYGL